VSAAVHTAQPMNPAVPCLLKRLRSHLLPEQILRQPERALDGMIGRFADGFNSRRWFIRYLLFAEWVLVVTFA
jgi:hypothetical protein